jgi:hypothetical protein
MVGNADKVKIDKLFPDSNVQNQQNKDGGEAISEAEVMKAQTIQKISDNLLSGFAPAESLLHAFQSNSNFKCNINNT